MAKYVLSNRADADLDEIYVYTYRSFGEEQADSYFLSLRDSLQEIVSSPHLGQSVESLMPGLLCHRHASHRIYYLAEDDGIFVLRVLHQSIEFKRHIG